MPQKVAGAAGGGGGKSTCASTVEAAQRSDMPLLTTMAADMANFHCLASCQPHLACGASVLFEVARGAPLDCALRHATYHIHQPINFLWEWNDHQLCTPTSWWRGVCPFHTAAKGM